MENNSRFFPNSKYLFIILNIKNLPVTGYIITYTFYLFENCLKQLNNYKYTKSILRFYKIFTHDRPKTVKTYYDIISNINYIISYLTSI